VRVVVSIVRFAFATAVASSSVSAQGVPDQIFTGGRIFTADSAKPWAEAIAIRGDRIVAVGRTAAITKLAGPKTKRIALGGRVVVPGFNDAHDHSGSSELGTSFVTGTAPWTDPRFKQVFDSLKAIAARVKPGTWITGTVGPAFIDDQTARRGALDRAAPNNPVMLTLFTGHGVFFNGAALTLLDLGDKPADPLGGRYEYERGKLTGYMEEYAGSAAIRTLFSRQRDDIVAASFRRYANDGLAMGITSATDMADALTAIKTSRVLTGTPLPIRMRIVPFPFTTSAGRAMTEWRTVPARLAPATIVSGVKYILDGTPIERLELLRRPYADKSGWYGRANFPPDTIRAILKEALAGNQQTMLHITGDSLVKFVVTEMQQLAADSVWRTKRLRIEHGDGIAPDLQPLVARLGIVVVVNPTHFAAGEIVKKRLEPAVAAGYHPLKSLLARGIVVAIGSDGPRSPFINVMLAAQHPFNPGEAISREQAVRAYTWGSAYAEFAEKEKGALSVGMLADLAVLSQDIFTVPSAKLPVTTSVLTLVGGKVVYDAKVLVATP
jgi:predicted amidohydrolase YtcJ